MAGMDPPSWQNKRSAVVRESREKVRWIERGAGDFMPLHPAEETTLRAFVVAAKRDRMLMLFGSAKRRRQACSALNHFADWDPRYVHEVPSSANVVAILIEKVPGTFFVSGCHYVAGETVAWEDGGILGNTGGPPVPQRGGSHEAAGSDGVCFVCNGHRDFGELVG